MKHRGARIFIILCILVVTAAAVYAQDSGGASPLSAAEASLISGLPWWGWVLLLFVFTIVLGIVAVIAGIGGGVLFVPIVSTLFPFGFDFVRGAGLLVALSGAISAGPRLLRTGLSNLRLALPLSLLGAVGSIAGAVVGLALPDIIVQLMLGFAIIGIVVLMLSAKNSLFPKVTSSDTLSAALQIHGIYYEQSLKEEVHWKIHRMPLGMAAFVAIGFMAGMFGVGAGWANVPALNLLLGAPLKIAIATSSGLILTVNDAAIWVYLNKGAILPLIALPSVAGMMIGTNIGARILPHIKPQIARWIVIVLLIITGLRYVLKGLGIMG